MITVIGQCMGAGDYGQAEYFYQLTPKTLHLDPSDHPWMGRYRRLVGYDPGLAFPGRAVPAAFQEQKMAADQIDLIRAAVF